MHLAILLYIFCTHLVSLYLTEDIDCTTLELNNAMLPDTVRADISALPRLPELALVYHFYKWIQTESVSDFPVCMFQPGLPGGSGVPHIASEEEFRVMTLEERSMELFCFVRSLHGHTNHHYNLIRKACFKGYTSFKRQKQEYRGAFEVILFITFSLI